MICSAQTSQHTRKRRAQTSPIHTGVKCLKLDTKATIDIVKVEKFRYVTFEMLSSSGTDTKIVYHVANSYREKFLQDAFLNKHPREDTQPFGFQIQAQTRTKVTMFEFKQ